MTENKKSKKVYIAIDVNALMLLFHTDHESHESQRIDQF